MLLSREELELAAVPTPEVKKFFKDRPPPSLQGADYNVVRGFMKMVDEANSKVPPPPGVTEIYHDIAMRDGFTSNIKVHKPSQGSPGPLIVLAFGGAFMAGSNEQLSKTARLLVRLFGATVVNISYRLSPEHIFPTSQLDAWDSMKWIASHASESLLDTDPTKGFIMGGVSAGASITAALSRQFQKEPLAHPLTGQWLAMPSCVGHANVPEEYKGQYLSMDQTSDAPVLNLELIQYGLKISQAPVSHPLRQAICDDAPLPGQPKTYFQVDGLDPLRDDGLIYHEILNKAGVETRIDFYPGCPHVHFSSVPGTSVAAEGNIDSLVGFGWLLGQHVSRGRAAEVLSESESDAEVARPL